MSEHAPVDLVFLWHQHQPDYRSPRDGEAQLPWVRLHATKDYLDMVLRLERFPRVRAAFNFVPSLLDQLDDAARGAPDAFFDLLRRAPATLEREQREAVAARCANVPRWALERWPAFAALLRRVGTSPPGDGDLVALECYFLLAWLDPMFHREPEAARAIAESGALRVEHRDALLALHDRLVREVIPAHAEREAAGQIELSASPYCHPILPLLIDSRHARRSRPDAPLPAETFAAPEDASEQITRARVRHAEAFGRLPEGMWPSEGSVSPEAVALAARAGVRWLATDEGVLWQSLPVDRRARECLYRPWSFATPDGEVALLFRDHELSDRIGFVYSRWSADDAVADFLERVRRIGRENAGEHPALVSVILDGENCWEHYPEDGGPFLDALYAALERADDIRTRTPSEAVRERGTLSRLDALHSGSWIDADFHIWIGHPEKNRAWDALARARRALVESGATGETHPGAWQALYAAEGSDWFWWFGDDHFTSDRALFDRIFREHVQAAYERADLIAPAALRQPIAGAQLRAEGRAPIGFLEPTIDGRRTGFYEWHEAGEVVCRAGSSMHRAERRVTELLYGFDAENVFLRLGTGPGVAPPDEIRIEVLAPQPGRFRIAATVDGYAVIESSRRGDSMFGARAAIDEIVEVALPLELLGVGPGEALELIVQVMEGGVPVESAPPDGTLSLVVPDASFPMRMWSA